MGRQAPFYIIILPGQLYGWKWETIEARGFFHQPQLAQIMEIAN